MCEPMSIAHHGHTVGELAPGLRDKYTGLRVAHHLLVGHGRVVQAFRASGAPGEIGIIHGIADIQPASDDPADIAAAIRTDNTSTDCSSIRSCWASTRRTLLSGGE